jgi:TDG/mug DNA glycosylase family protein
VAFTGKKAASMWLHRRTDRIAYGRQKRRPEVPFEVFVLPSPSAAARRYWQLEPWHQLADWLRATRPWRF